MNTNPVCRYTINVINVSGLKFNSANILSKSFTNVYECDYIQTGTNIKGRYIPSRRSKVMLEIKKTNTR